MEERGQLAWIVRLPAPAVSLVCELLVRLVRARGHLGAQGADRASGVLGAVVVADA